MQPGVSYVLVGSGCSASPTTRCSVCVCSGVLLARLPLKLEAEEPRPSWVPCSQGNFQMPREGLVCLLSDRMVWLAQTTLMRYLGQVVYAWEMLGT